MTIASIRLSGVLIAFVGSALAAMLLVDAATTADQMYWTVQLYPIALTFVLVGTGVLLARGRLVTDRYVGRLLAWMGIGIVALSLLAAYLYGLMVLVAGYEPLDTPVGAVTAVTFGALVGLLVGIYDARALKRAHEITQLSHVNDTLRIATGELVEQTDREALEQTICERLAESDAYSGAWISRSDVGSDAVHPVAWAGLDDTDIGPFAMSTDGGSTNGSVYNRAAETETVQFVQDIRATTDQLREPFDRDSMKSLAVVPIVGVDRLYGLLGVYSNQPFEEQERAIFTELGETVGQAIASIRAREELKLREQELVAHNERLDKFASVVSHDLRNPLSVILGRVEYMSDPDEQDNLDVIAKAGQRMEAIIADLLALSRVGETVDDLLPVDLAVAADDSWKNVETAGVDFELSVPSGTIVEADRDRLLTVFENLFRNAIEHNSRPLTVRVGLLPASDDEESFDGWFIEDDGSGIPATNRDEIFDHGYTTNTNGTGFGLSIVEEIVSAHGWTIRIAASADGGARFEIRT